MPRLTRSRQGQGGEHSSPLKQLKSPAPKKRTNKTAGQKDQKDVLEDPPLEFTPTRSNRRKRKPRRKYKKLPRSPKQPARTVQFEGVPTHTLERTRRRSVTGSRIRNAEIRSATALPRRGGGQAGRPTLPMRAPLQQPTPTAHPAHPAGNTERPDRGSASTWAKLLVSQQK